MRAVTRLRRPGRTWASCLALAGALSLWGAGPALAHPFGDPQRLEVSGEGSTVRARWRAAGDDLTALALALRVLREKRTYVYENGALVPEESDESDAVTLSKSPQLADYLLRNIRVSDRGANCPGRVASTENLAEDGALVEFSCPGAVTSAEVTVRMLTDIHESYRTLASGPRGERHTYTKAAATHTWSLDRSMSAGRVPAGAAPWLVAAAVAAVLAVAVGVHRFRGGRRRGPA